MRTVGPERNARLTALTGAVLLVLLAVEGFTLISLRDACSRGTSSSALLVVPVVALKLGSTGYQLLSATTRGAPTTSRRGRRICCCACSGRSSSLIDGRPPRDRDRAHRRAPGRGLMLLLHKASFVVWVGALGAHVLGHLGRLPRALRSDLGGQADVAGSRLRLLLVAAPS